MSLGSYLAKGLILVGAGAAAKIGLDYVDQKSKEKSEGKPSAGGDQEKAERHSRESAGELTGKAGAMLPDTAIRSAPPKGAKRLMGQCETCGKQRADVEDRCERKDCPHR